MNGSKAQHSVYEGEAVKSQPFSDIFCQHLLTRKASVSYSDVAVGEK